MLSFEYLQGLLNILFVTCKISFVAILIETPVAIYLAWLLVKSKIPAKAVLQSIIMLPMVTTPLVIGFFLLELFHPQSFIGKLFRSLNIDIIFNWKGAVIAVSLISLPLYIMTIVIAFQKIDTKLELVSSCLGKTRWQTFWRVTFPLSYHGIVQGALLAFTRNMGEFGATVVILGIIPSNSETISIAIHRYIQIPNQESKLYVLILLSLLLSSICVFLCRSCLSYKRVRI